MTRREFAAAAMAAGAASFMQRGFSAEIKRTQLHGFSKNFTFLSREELCDIFAAAGLMGVEWCIRSGGHVDPLAVQRELPSAVKAAQSRNLSSVMVCTRSKGDGTDRAEEGDIVETLKVCADCGVKFWRPGSFVYDTKLSVRDNLEVFRRKFSRLEEISRITGVKCAYQNHFGCFGGGVYDMLDIVRELSGGYFTLQYDILHAVFETPVSWERHLREAAPFISCACLKDCNELARQKEDMWKTFRTVKAPEGVVPFERYVRLLGEMGVNVPHSVHFEFPLPKNDRAALTAAVQKEAGYFRRLFAM